MRVVESARCLKMPRRSRGYKVTIWRLPAIKTQGEVCNVAEVDAPGNKQHFISNVKPNQIPLTTAALRDVAR